MQYKISDTVWREDQFEIIYEVFDDDGELISGGIRLPVGKEKPDEKQLDVLFNDRIFPELAASLNAVPEAVEQTYTKTEVEALMIEKGYLKESEKLEDLKPATELVAASVAAEAGVVK